MLILPLVAVIKQPVQFNIVIRARIRSRGWECEIFTLLMYFSLTKIIMQSAILTIELLSQKPMRSASRYGFDAPG